MISERQQWINLGMFVVAEAAIATFMIGDKIKRRWLRILTGISVSLVFTFVVWWTLPLYDWLLGIIQYPLILALLTILLGVAAHAFKKKNKLRYGQVEVLVGMLTAVGIATATGQSLLAQSISLAAAAYVVARGLNNWDEQLAEHGDKHGNHSIWQHIRYLMIEEVEDKDQPAGK